MNTALAVMIGGAIGSLLRYGISVWCVERLGESFPWGTILVNIAGSFGIGLFAGLTWERGILPLPPGVQAFIAIGFFGGFTTFSSFSLQTLRLAQDGAWLAAGSNVVLSVILCLLAVWLGHVAAMGLGAGIAGK